MFFGLELGWTTIMYVGIAVFSLLVFELLVGLRVIQFKGRTHMKVHRRTAFALVVLAGVHGALAMILYNDWKVF